MHQGNLLRRGFATLTQNLERLPDGISDSGSEEQALRFQHCALHASMLGACWTNFDPLRGVRQIQGDKRYYILRMGGSAEAKGAKIIVMPRAKKIKKHATDSLSRNR